MIPYLKIQLTSEPAEGFKKQYTYWLIYEFSAAISQKLTSCALFYLKAAL